MNDLRQRLIAAFQDEQRDYLIGIRCVMAKLVRANGIVPDAELDEAFRLAHCFKAAARVCDFRTVETIGQRVETMFARARTGNAPTPGTLTEVEQTLDAVERWGSALGANAAAPEPVESLHALDRALNTAVISTSSAHDLSPQLLAAFQVEHTEHLEEIRAILAVLAAGKTLHPAQVDEMFRRAHSLKGAARIAGIQAVETLAHELETLFAAVRDGQRELDPRIVDSIGEALDAIEDAAAAFLGGRSHPLPGTALARIERVLMEPAASDPSETLRHPAPPPVAAPPVESVRVSAENLDRLLRSAGQLLTEGQRQNLVTRELAELGRQIDELAQGWKTVRGGSTAALRHIAEIPEFASIATYLHLAELRMQALVKKTRSLRQLQQRSAWDLQQQVGRLHQDARRVRMVSAESVLQGFRKMVRDLAGKEGKRIDFHVSGFEIQADRLVLQALKDPLMHALVNAVTHGIELPAERVRHGKDEIGRIGLHLEVAGNRLHIEVGDDGRGIDGSRVADAAIRNGLLSEVEAEALSPAEQMGLVFRPGLSTASEVTDVSGRGMGLSVVHQAAARLQGEVVVTPRDGPGTRLAFSVPLSISTQRMLLVKCGDQTFGVPVHAIESLLRVKRSAIEVVEGRLMIVLAGHPIPVRALDELLGLSGYGLARDENVYLMVLRSATGRLAVAADVFLSERDYLLKNLDAPAARLKKFAGGILLEDGSIVLVLNPAELLRAPTPGRQEALSGPSSVAPKKQTRTVLVVDDSLTTRTLEKGILEANGYVVLLAVDGVEALVRLREAPVDLVITDVQMPRMNGFELLDEIKKDPRLAHLPVIVVTSLDKREDQERGLALGANAYVVKSKFDHEELLETIRQIL